MTPYNTTFTPEVKLSSKWCKLFRISIIAYNTAFTAKVNLSSKWCKLFQTSIIANDTAFTKKQYKRLVKDKENAFRKKMLDSISQREKNTPNLFWDMANRLRSCKNKNLADNTDPEEWYKWFRDLNKPQFIINKWDKAVEGVVKRLKDFTCFNEG